MRCIRRPLQAPVLGAWHRIAIITTINGIAIITTMNIIAIITTINRIAIITTSSLSDLSRVGRRGG